MKALLALNLLVFTSFATIQDAKSAGQEVCYGIIDGYSPGSLHLQDCLLAVDDIFLKNPSISPMEMVEAVCLASKDFWFSASFAEAVEGQCLADAIEEGMLPNDFIVPEFD